MDIFYNKTYKLEPNKTTNPPKYILPIWFHNNGLNFIHVYKILRNEEVISKLPSILQTGETLTFVYNLGYGTPNKLLNHKYVSTIYVNHLEAFGTRLGYCSCKGLSFVNQGHDHIVTRDLHFIDN